MIHLPVLVVLVPLFSAVIIPLLPKQKSILFGFVTLMFSVMLGLVFVSYIDVNDLGTFRYVFGNYAPSIGIEFLVDPLISFLALFVTALAFLIVVYSFTDIQHELKEHQLPYYYILIMLIMFLISLNNSSLFCYVAT